MEKCLRYAEFDEKYGGRDLGEAKLEEAKHDGLLYGCRLCSGEDKSRVCFSDGNGKKEGLRDTGEGYVSVSAMRDLIRRIEKRKASSL